MIEPLELRLDKGNEKIIVDMHDVFSTVESAYRLWVTELNREPRTVTGLIYANLPEELIWEYEHCKTLKDLLHSMLQNAMECDTQFPDYNSEKTKSITDKQGKPLGVYDLGLLERLDSEYITLGVPFVLDDKEDNPDTEEDE